MLESIKLSELRAFCDFELQGESVAAKHNWAKPGSRVALRFVVEVHPGSFLQAAAWYDCCRLEVTVGKFLRCHNDKVFVTQFGCLMIHSQYLAFETNSWNPSCLNRKRGNTNQVFHPLVGFWTGFGLSVLAAASVNVAFDGSDVSQPLRWLENFPYFFLWKLNLINKLHFCLWSTFIISPIDLALGVLTSSIRVRVRRFLGFVLGGLSSRVSSELSSDVCMGQGSQILIRFGEG